jgi:hypothetical protein
MRRHALTHKHSPAHAHTHLGRCRLETAGYTQQVLADRPPNVWKHPRPCGRAADKTCAHRHISTGIEPARGQEATWRMVRRFHARVHACLCDGGVRGNCPVSILRWGRCQAASTYCGGEDTRQRACTHLCVYTCVFLSRSVDDTYAFFKRCGFETQGIIMVSLFLSNILPRQC